MSIHELFAYLRVKNAPAAIDYYQRAFGAVEKFRLVEPSGRVGHAELLLGPATLMLSEEYPELGINGPETIGQTSVTIHLHVDDCDAMLARAVEHGGVLVRPPTDAFHGERGGTVRDPFGHEWNIGHSIEDVAPDEMQRRYTKLMTKG
ncbi:MAG: VOC family protein [Kofleriaceae bacterium]|nr:MAG: VOC family protein [Kofleriaceae bacterium]